MPACRNFDADAVVQAHAASHLDDVGARLLADVGDLVDEGDLRGEEGVGGELDHLRAGDVGAHERSFEGRVELDDRVPRPAAVVADDDSVGVQEVVYGGALLEELGAGHVAEAALALFAEGPAQRCAGAAGHRRLHHERVVFGGGDRVDDRVHGREVGVAGVRRRRADGDEQQTRVLERVAQVGREVQPLGVARQQLLEARLVDRHLAATQALDLLGVDVDAPDVAAELGEAGGGDQADVAGADHSDGLRGSAA